MNNWRAANGAMPSEMRNSCASLVLVAKILMARLLSKMHFKKNNTGISTMAVVIRRSVSMKSTIQLIFLLGMAR